MESSSQPASPLRLLTSRRRLLSIGVGALAIAGQVGAAPAPTTSEGLTAQTTEGPYYLELSPMRADITEGLTGVPLDIRIMVLDESGRPFDGARVDVWHCDAAGNYSGFVDPRARASGAPPGKTFLRGSLMTGQGGAAIFHSLYPGWYHGRTTHIHFKVRNGAKTNLTSQFFLPDALSEFLYAHLPAYRRKDLRDTLNSTDGIALEAGSTVRGMVREDGDRYLAALTVRVDREANPPIDRPPALGEGPPPGEDPRRRGPPPGGRPPPGFGGGPALTGEARIEGLVPHP